MGISMHLGLLSGLGDILGDILGWVFNTILTPILKLVVKAIILTIQYSLASVFYTIASLLLQLVDFVEVIFRALAGLPNDDMTLSLAGSGSDNPDLLIQMLRSEVVVQAFMSCCIVGLFLLIITTIFQMLKVEYTTEGANNSKSSIFAKSLKSLANLVLIPVLVIFGTVIGNSVLNLIDTATGGGDGASIGGLLWTTAAADAMWNNGEPPDWLWALAAPTLIEPGSATTTMVTLGAITGLIAAFDFNDDNSEYGSGAFSGALMGDRTPEKRKQIENQFLTGEKSYANPFYAMESYNLFEVNYLLLIVGACILIKCLFHCCFGLVDRIYQCVALFIVSPFVIGMSPVKDSLGSWRSKFIQKALSAYGTIISINLFFIIVSLFLNIEINIMPTASSVIMLSSAFMEGLVKAIFVIVGALMIEKLAGDLGQYFGGGNAMAEGKGLAGEVGKAAASVVKTGVGVASMAAGGAGLALKGIGMAAKLGKGAAAGVKAAKTAGGSKVKGAFSGMKDAAVGSKRTSSQVSLNDAKERELNAVKDYDKATNGMNMSDFEKYESDLNGFTAEQSSAEAEMKKQEAIMNDDTKTAQERAAAKKAHAEASQKYSNAGQAINNLKKNSNSSRFDKAIAAKQELEDARTEKTKAEKEVSDAKEGDEARAKLRRDKFQTNYNAFMQMGKDLGGSMPGMKWMNDLKGDWDKARKTGNSYSEESQQALKNVEEAESKRKAESHNNGLINTILNKQNLNESTQKIAKAMIERAEFKTSDLNDQMTKLVKEYGDLVNKLNNTPNLTDQQKKDLGDEITYKKGQIRNLKADVKFEGNQVLNATIEFDMSEFKKNIESALKKNATKDEINKIISDQLKKWGESGNENVLKEIRKAIEEIKGELK